MVFSLTKWVHVLSAIVALGANVTYGIWLGRAARKPEVLPFTLKTIKVLDDRVANPAYALLLITGLAMVWLARFQLATPWILTSLVLYVGLLLLGLLGYTPTLKRQIELIEREGPASQAFQDMSRRATVQGAILGVLAVAIVFMMVVKPALWA